MLFRSSAGTSAAALAFAGATTTPPQSRTATMEIWTTGVTVPVAGTFSSGGNLNTARRFVGGAGTQTATLAFSGVGPGGASGSTESYNGSSWTSVNSMGTARYGVAGGGPIGTQTASLVIGGYNGSAVATVES